MRISQLRRFLIVACLGVVSLSFQNCETSKQSQAIDDPTSKLSALNCTVPWQANLQVLDGKTVEAFSSATVPEGQTCESEVRSCAAGVLSGTFNFGSCQVAPSVAKDCAVPWSSGIVVKDGSDVDAFKVVAGVCEKEVRSCAAGTLSGSFELSACPDIGAVACELPFGGKLEEGMKLKVKDADGTPFLENDCGVFVEYTCLENKLKVEGGLKDCPPDSKDCELPWGDKLANGTSKDAYKVAKMPAGGNCKAENVEKRMCVDGKLSGSFTNKTCEVAKDKTLTCKIFFKSGGTAATEVKDQAGCFAYYEAIKKANAQTQTIVKITLEGKVLPIPKDEIKGTYKGYFIKGGKKSLFITTANTTLEASLKNCKLNASNNPKNGIECTFNGLVIYSKAEPQPVKDGVYKGYFVKDGQKSLFITTAKISKADALANCKLNSSNNPTKGIYCTWEGDKIFEKEEPKPVVEKECKITFVSGASAASKQKTEAACNAYYAEIKKNNPNSTIRKVTFGSKVLFELIERGGILKISIVEGGTASGMGIADISLAAAKKHCAAIAKEKPKAGIKCEFDGKLFFEQKETKDPAVKLAEYKGYLVKNGQKKLFITTAKISKVEALENCKLNAKNNPNDGIYCTWDGAKLYEEAEPIDRGGILKITIVENGKTSGMGIADISLAGAKSHCAAVAKDKPKAGIVCEFDGQVIFKQKEVTEPQVKLATYKGYFVKGGDKTLFITTKDISKKDALANCKLNHKNNPTKGIYCTWDGDKLFEAAKTQ